MHPTSSILHHYIIQALLQRGRPPTPEEIGEAFEWSSSETSRALGRLADDHGAVLHPKSDDIWVIHPFACAPTPFLVRAGDRRWWGNCAWLVDDDVEIITTLGAEAEQVTLRIRERALLDQDFVVHFPVEMSPRSLFR